VLTDPVGAGWYQGTLEALVEGSFSYVFKHQRTYSAGVNLLARYNFLTHSDVWRPYVQAGFGVVHTNLVMDNFGSNVNFVSSAACGLQYFFTKRNAVSLEWRVFHMSNAGLDHENSGLNVNNFFLGLSYCF
jgi:outer membrane protein W